MTMILVAYAQCGCRATALLLANPTKDDRTEFEEDARAEGWTVREEDHDGVGAKPCAQHADCTCAAIQAADPRRHFKGCLKREDLPEADQRAIDAAAASASEVMQDDMAHLLRTLGLSDHARPQSPHRVMVDEVIPEVLRLRKDTERLDEYRQRAQAEPAPMDCDCRSVDPRLCASPSPSHPVLCGCPHHRQREAPVATPGDTSGPNVHVALKQRAAQLATQLLRDNGLGTLLPDPLTLDERKELLFIVRHLLG